MILTAMTELRNKTSLPSLRPFSVLDDKNLTIHKIGNGRFPRNHDNHDMKDM